MKIQFKNTKRNTDILDIGKKTVVFYNIDEDKAENLIWEMSLKHFHFALWEHA